MAVATVVVLALASPAGAHAQLESSQPDQSSVLATPPRQVVLHFGEPVEIDFGSIRVIGPEGNRVDEGGTHHPSGDGHAVAISLPAHLADGTYVVAWRVISADSHPVHGAFVFSVGTAAGAGKANALAASVSSGRGSALVGVIFWLVRFAAFTSLVVLVGVAAVITAAWPAGAGTRRVGRLLWASWAVLFVSSVAGVAVQGVYASSLPFSDVTQPSLFNQVLHTRFGEVEILRIVVLIALIPVVRSLRGGLVPALRSGMIVLGAVGALGLLVTPGLAGHASTGSDPILGIALDVLHLAAVSVWIGGLAVLGMLLVPGLPLGSRPGDIRSMALKFSAYAFGAVMVVVATGVIQSIRQVGSFYALFNTTYGITLSIKIGFVVVLIALGAVSRRFVLGGWVGPRLARRVRSLRADTAGTGPLVVTGGPQVREGEVVLDGGAGRRSGATTPGNSTQAETVRGGGHFRGLRVSVCTEIAIALTVLAVTALLVNAVPAKQAANQPFSQTFNVLGDQINAIVSPAKIGAGNQFHFYVLGPGGAPVAIPELDAAISLPSEGVGPLAIPLVVATPGHFRASDVDIPLAGDWSLKVTVRTSPIDEQEVVTRLLIH
jgi:copper transport protein